MKCGQLFSKEDKLHKTAAHSTLLHAFVFRYQDCLVSNEFLFLHQAEKQVIFMTIKVSL